LEKFVQFLNGAVLGCPVPAEIDYLNTGLVQYSNGHCTIGFVCSSLHKYQDCLVSGETRPVQVQDQINSGFNLYNDVKSLSDQIQKFQYQYQKCGKNKVELSLNQGNRYHPYHEAEVYRYHHESKGNSVFFSS
jgi:hypothetical protein